MFPSPPTSQKRREFLSRSGLSGLGLLWANSLSQNAAAATHGKAKSVILIFNCGAPSHIDLWDLKPHATDTVRGPYKPIATSAPGVEISELLPRLAKHAHRFSIVRSVHHSHGGHNSGMHWSIVGRPYPMDSTLINPSRNDIPSFGTLVGWLENPTRSARCRNPVRSLPQTSTLRSSPRSATIRTASPTTPTMVAPAYFQMGNRFESY